MKKWSARGAAVSGMFAFALAELVFLALLGAICGL